MILKVNLYWKTKKNDEKSRTCHWRQCYLVFIHTTLVMSHLLTAQVAFSRFTMAFVRLKIFIIHFEGATTLYWVYSDVFKTAYCSFLVVLERNVCWKEDEYDNGERKDHAKSCQMMENAILIVPFCRIISLHFFFYFSELKLNLWLTALKGATPVNY